MNLLPVSPLLLIGFTIAALAVAAAVAALADEVTAVTWPGGRGHRDA
jgi:hypothetical protein